MAYSNNGCGICWYCHWGWPKPIADIYTDALEKLGGDESPLHFGPAHIVWEDENFGSAQWCINHFNEYRGDYSDAALDVVMESLQRLAALPQEAFEACPDDYDGENPELFPPTREVVQVKWTMTKGDDDGLR